MNKSHISYQEDLRYILNTKGIEQLKGKSILITGATGLIGVCMIDALMMLGNVKVYATGRSRKKAESRLGEHFGNPMFEFIEHDVCNAFPSDIKVDYIIPCASNTHPLAYSQYPVETMLINIKGAEHALELAIRQNATVLYPSSVEIYGNAYGFDEFTEDYTGKLNLATSRACYTESKRSCEALCQSYISEHGANVKIVRLSRVFGPTMLESDSKASSQFIKKAIAGEDIVLKSNGEQYFSYTYVADAVSAMLFVMLNGQNGMSYNISAEDCNVHLKDFASICANIAGKDVIFDLPSETEKKGFSIAVQAVLDNSRIKELGWSPEYTMEDAVRRTVSILM